MSTTPMQTKRPARRRAIRCIAASLTAALALSAHGALAGYNIWTGEYTFTRDQLEQALAQRFPATLRYGGGLLSVELSHPRLLLDPASNRVTTQVDARIDNLVLNGAPLNGSLALNSGIRYDPARHAVLLDNPTLQQVQVAGMPAQYQEPLNAIGATAAQQLLKDYPLYTFKPEELHIGGRDIEPGAITVLSDGISVQIKQR